MISIIRPECPHPEALANRNYKHPRNKLALMNASSDKCMYCESSIRHIDFGDIEHIKPKAEDKYPHLAFEWDNLGYSCRCCNSNKSDKYDVETPYVNPYEENPEEHFAWRGAIMLAKRGCERAMLTINDVKLNRVSLVEKRVAKITDVDNAVSACFRLQNVRLRQQAIDELIKFSEKDSEFSACIASVLSAHGV